MDGIPAGSPIGEAGIDGAIGSDEGIPGAIGSGVGVLTGEAGLPKGDVGSVTCELGIPGIGGGIGVPLGDPEGGAGVVGSDGVGAAGSGAGALAGVAGSPKGE